MESFDRFKLIKTIISASLLIAITILFNILECDKIIILCGYLLVYLFAGYDIIIDGVKEFFSEPFNEDFLMIVASVGAFILGEYFEGTIVMVLFSFGELLEGYATQKSEKAIATLTELIPKKAKVLVDDIEEEKDVDKIVVGDILLLKVGDVIPCDGEVIFGTGFINNSVITGESLPVRVNINDRVLAGGVVEQGLLKVKVIEVSEKSQVNKILDLIDSKDKKAKGEKFITKFARVYTPIVLILALLTAIIPSIITGEWQEYIKRGLNFLVISCPCALVISVPMAFFSGVGKGFKQGIMIKGGFALEKASQIKTVAFDKTGTLTDGSFAVKCVAPIQNIDRIKRLVGIAESFSNHPIANAILAFSGKVDSTGYTSEEIAGLGVIAKSKDSTIYVGNKKLMEKFNITIKDITCSCLSHDSETCVFVAENDEYVGRIMIGDKERENSEQGVALLKEMGIKTCMLTGDCENIASVYSQKLGIDSYKGGLLPQDKLSELKGLGDNVAFVGDGINDAPVLKNASVGIAMGGGTNVAVDCADVVIMDNDIKKVSSLLKLSKRVIKVVYENIIVSIGIKAIALILSAFFGIPMWIAVLCDVGVMSLAVLNALRLTI